MNKSAKQLSRREQEIATAIIDYKFNENCQLREIADRLYISYGTLRKHRDNIYKKLEVSNVIQLKLALRE